MSLDVTLTGADPIHNGKAWLLQLPYSPNNLVDLCTGTVQYTPLHHLSSISQSSSVTALTAPRGTLGSGYVNTGHSKV